MADNKDYAGSLKEIQEYSDYLTRLHSPRNTLYDTMEKIHLLKWDDESKVKERVGEDVKVTLHPGARNAAQGAIRLMIAADPEFSVPMETNNRATQKMSSNLEKMAKAMWLASGRVLGRPVHYDVVTSAILFAEMHIDITKTADMVEWAKGGSKAAQARAEEIAACTPMLFQARDPRTGYPDIGTTGLTAFYREVEVLSGQVLDEFGADAKAVLKDSSRYTKMTLCQFWDYENRHVWVKGNSIPLKQEAHGLPFIPVVVQLGEGSSLFKNPEDQRQPFLYTEWKSGLWSRLNLIMTVLHTLTFWMGSNPLYLFKANQAGKTMTVDHSRPGGVTVIENNEDFAPLSTKVVDPAMLELYATDERLEEESTIYSQTLGESLGKNAPFSSVALLHQAGRLPLIVPQRMAGWAIGSAAKIAMRWLKEGGLKAKAKYEGTYAELKPSDIPDYIDITASLKAELPQDKVQETNIAMQASSGETPLVSQRYAREEILGIGQSDEMQWEIWSERAGFTKFMEYIRVMMEAEMKRRALQNQPPGGEPTPGNVAPDQAPGAPMQPVQPMPSGMQMQPNPEEPMR